MSRSIASARSWLFVPGDRPDRFAKAAATADAVILDLEDAVPSDRKAEARISVGDFLANGTCDEAVVAVRINPVETLAGLEDLRALLRPGLALDAIVAAKVEGSASLCLIDRLASEAGLGARLVALIESARGLHHVGSIAGACERLSGLMFGAADYSADLGQSPEVLDARYARAAIANAAAMEGLVAIDSPFFSIDDAAALAQSCAAAIGLGFHAKAAIHPKQVPLINDGFSPSAEEIERATRVLQLSDGGASAIDGKMIDIAILRWARGIVSRAV